MRPNCSHQQNLSVGGPWTSSRSTYHGTLSPIFGRRRAHNVISQIYGGARWAWNHSSNGPGTLSDQLRSQFLKAGYPLMTSKVGLPGLIEVYRHSAIRERQPS